MKDQSKNVVIKTNNTVILFNKTYSLHQYRSQQMVLI